MKSDLAIEQLLGRAVLREAAPEARAFVKGLRVMVTGAGGSIGSELARQCAALGCAHLSLLDNAATALFDVDAIIAHEAPQLSRREILCDIRDAARLADWVAAERPDVIFHAAAIKHVNLVERHPSEGALTNLIGARNVAAAADQAGATMTLISTDKAATPVSAMGKTKRLAERVVREFDRVSPRGKFASVRFGNVFGSSNSVAPIFRQQIARGGPLTITDPAMERYFMTGAEAVRLTIAATALRAQRGRGRAGVFILEMGAPVRIVDLARRMIDAYAPDPEAIRIEYVGARPGEILSERLVDDDEAVAKAPIAGVKELVSTRARQPIAFAMLDEIEASARAGDDDGVNRLLDAALKFKETLPLSA